jgi:hypothetical protein
VKSLTCIQMRVASCRQLVVIFDQTFRPSHHLPYELFVLNETTNELESESALIRLHDFRSDNLHYSAKYSETGRIHAQIHSCKLTDAADHYISSLDTVQPRRNGRYRLTCSDASEEHYSWPDITVNSSAQNGSARGE